MIAVVEVVTRMPENEQTYWNGEPTPARKVRLKIAAQPQFPHYWAATEGRVGEIVDAVEVSYFPEGPFYLLDDEGQGWPK